VQEGLVRKNILLKELRNKKVDLPGLLKKVGEWVAEEVQTYQFRDMPIKPKEVLDYERIPEPSRKNIDVTYFYDHPQILAFYKLRHFVFWENLSLYEWLKECLGYVNTEEEKVKILHKMSEFPTTKGGE